MICQFCDRSRAVKLTTLKHIRLYVVLWGLISLLPFFSHTPSDNLGSPVVISIHFYSRSLKKKKNLNKKPIAVPLFFGVNIDNCYAWRIQRIQRLLLITCHWCTKIYVIILCNPMLIHGICYSGVWELFHHSLCHAADILHHDNATIILPSMSVWLLNSPEVIRKMKEKIIVAGLFTNNWSVI